MGENNLRGRKLSPPEGKLGQLERKGLLLTNKFNTMKNIQKTIILTESNSKQMLKKASSDIKLLDMNEEIKNIRILKAAWQDNGEAKDGNKHLKQYQKSQKVLKKLLRTHPLTLKLQFASEYSEHTDLPIAISTVNFEIVPQMVKQVQELYQHEMYEKDSVKYFVSGDIFHQADIPLQYLNGTLVPKGTPVYVPVCSAQNQALIIGLYKMSEQAVLQGEDPYVLTNVQIKDFNSVQDFARYMAVNYSQDRGFRSKEKIKVASYATYHEFMQKVYQVSKNLKIPVNTVIKYYTQGKLLTPDDWVKAWQGKVVDNVKYDLSVGDTIIETLQNLDLGECLKRPYLIDAIAQLMKTKSGKDGDKYGIGKVINAIHNLTSRDVENILGDPRNVCNIFSILKDRVDSMLPLLVA